MKKEEAIKRLTDMHKFGGLLGLELEDRQALSMGVDALEQKPILDKIRAEIAEISKKYPMTMDYENGLKEALEIIDKYKAENEE